MFAGLPEIAEAVVCAPGPSLNAEDCEYIKGKAYTIAVNDAHRLADCDLLYASDHSWWRHYPELASRDFLRVCGAQQDKAPDWVQTVPAQHTASLCGAELNFGSNSGFAALHLAILMGAKRVILLGYDVRKVGGMAHFFGAHPSALRNSSNYESMIGYFNQAPVPQGVDIINCTKGSAIRRWPMQDIRETI